MKLSSEQLSVTRGAGLAAVFSTAFLVVGYLWFPFEFGSFEGPAARLVFALKADLFVFLWLVAAVARVANIRFFSPEDIQGGGLAEPSEGIKVPLGLLQNTQEQALLAVGAHLALASLLEGAELVVIPLLVALFCIGRAAFWIGYAGGAASRAFGFGTTFYPTVAAYVLAVILIFVR